MKCHLKSTGKHSSSGKPVSSLSPVGGNSGRSYSSNPHCPATSEKCRYTTRRAAPLPQACPRRLCATSPPLVPPAHRHGENASAAELLQHSMASPGLGGSSPRARAAEPDVHFQPYRASQGASQDSQPGLFASSVPSLGLQPPQRQPSLTLPCGPFLSVIPLHGSQVCVCARARALLPRPLSPSARSRLLDRDSPSVTCPLSRGRHLGPF